MNAISLFANVGLAETYLDELGVKVKVANEIDNSRSKFYCHLYPDTHMITGDFVEKKVNKKLIELAHKENIDTVIATPPCQGMSEAGSRHEFDERNQLIVQTVDFIEELMPKFVFIENVPLALKTKIKVDNEVLLIPEFIRSRLEKNYNINKDTIIAAMDCGISQMRKRSIFLMVRKDLNLEWGFPKKEKIITLRESIGNLPPLDPLLREGEEFTKKQFPKFTERKLAAEKISKWHKPPLHSWRQVKWMMHTPSGKSAIYNLKHFPVKKDGNRVKAHHNHYRRMHWDKPSRTITQNSGVISSLCCVHPGRKEGNMYSDPRALTIYELMIVSSIPLNWNIPDWANENLIRKVIGEGIPPLLVKKTFETLINQLD